jgi:cyclopropane fatty-acyl-phospholipid synthase-like methyltransferase
MVEILSAGLPEARTQMGYDAAYESFDSALMRGLRAEAYGEDIGQHSWVTADELRRDIVRLQLEPSSRLLDLGCGPCGPLTFILSSVGCRATGLELSTAAIAVGRTRAATIAVDHLLTLNEADLNERISVPSGSFDAAMSLDVILHLRDRATFFQDVAQALKPAGRFLFTDAGVVTGSISDVEVQRRSAHGFTQFVPPGFNEKMLERAGFRVLETEDRTASVVTNATGRLTARIAHRDELEELGGAADFERERQYLETVIEISRRGAVSRTMYLAESRRT